MIEIKYDNTLDEIKTAFLKFYFKYMVKKSALMTIVYLIAVVLGVDLVIKNSSSYAGFIVIALGVGMVVATWMRPFNVRRKLVKTLEGLYQEEYIARFYPDRIEIETIILDESKTEVVAYTKDGVEVVENPEIEKDVEVQPVVNPEKTVINIATEELFSAEDEKMFNLYVNRSLIYVFPKRCLSDENILALQNYFDDKAI